MLLREKYSKIDIKNHQEIISALDEKINAINCKYCLFFNELLHGKDMHSLRLFSLADFK